MKNCLKCGGDGWLWCCEIGACSGGECDDNRYLCTHCYPTDDNKEQVCLECDTSFHMCEDCDPKHEWMYQYCSRRCYILRKD